MTYTRPTLADDLETLPRIPSWVRSARAETLEDRAFMSGAALATLHSVLTRAEVPQSLLRERLALRAAEACVAFSGRMERLGDLRDEVHLLRPGDQPGPAGAIYVGWRRAVARPITAQHLASVVPEVAAPNIPVWINTAGPDPVGQAALVLEVILADFPKEEAAALMIADAVLARGLGWDRVVPLLAAGLKARDLRKTGDELRLSCHRAVVTSGDEAVRMAADLSRRAARLHAVTSKLRAKGAGKAVEMFLNRDALSPSLALTGHMTDRAARRLCDRLVDLGVVRELTGRPTFRLYGV